MRNTLTQYMNWREREGELVQQIFIIFMFSRLSNIIYKPHFLLLLFVCVEQAMRKKEKEEEYDEEKTQSVCYMNMYTYMPHLYIVIVCISEERH